MLVGYSDLVKTFKRLVAEDELSHSYIFFGEAQIGKATFAKSLANFLEFGEFEEPRNILTETLFILPDTQITKEESGFIGIDAIREAKRFLYSKPVRSKRRLVIIDEADKLTAQAQNAILKIAEEPPVSGLIVLVLSNPEVLLPTLQSRFQKIYFPRLSTAEVKNFLMTELKIKADKASQIAALSFGRIGRAKKIALDEEQAEILAEVKKFLRGGSSSQAAILKELINIKDGRNQGKVWSFLVELIALLALKKEDNFKQLKAILKRLSFLSQFNVNQRLQLTASLLWNT